MLEGEIKKFTRDRVNGRAVVNTGNGFNLLLVQLMHNQYSLKC